MEPQVWSELAQRWTRARHAALGAILGPGADLSDENAAADAALQQDEQEACRTVFENGLKLGTSFRRFHRHEVSLDEVTGALSAAGVPCLSGSWTPLPGQPAFALDRPPCAGRHGERTCDYWREAVDGLVLGLTGSCRHTRHRSAGHGDARCMDVVFADPESPLRFGLIPDEMKPALDGVARSIRMFDSRILVTFLGVSEGVLLYELSGSGAPAGLSVSHLVESQVARRFPNLKVRERAMRPVMDEQRGGI